MDAGKAREVVQAAIDARTITIGATRVDDKVVSRWLGFPRDTLRDVTANTELLDAVRTLFGDFEENFKFPSWGSPNRIFDFKDNDHALRLMSEMGGGKEKTPIVNLLRVT